MKYEILISAFDGIDDENWTDAGGPAVNDQSSGDVYSVPVELVTRTFSSRTS